MTSNARQLLVRVGLTVVFAKTTKITQTSLEWSLVRGNVDQLKLWAGMVTDRTFGSKTTLRHCHVSLPHACHYWHVPPLRAAELTPPPGAAATGPAISRSPGCECQPPQAFQPLLPGAVAVMPAESQNWWKTDLCSWGSSSFPWLEGKSKRSFESPAQCCPVNQEWWLVAAVAEDVAAQNKSQNKNHCSNKILQPRGGGLDGRAKE